MRHRIIALAAAAAIAATGFSSAPAQARDRGETAAIVAGVAALAIVGATLASDRNKQRRDYGHVSRGQGHGTIHYAPPRQRGYAFGHRSHRAHGFGFRTHRSHSSNRHIYRPHIGSSVRYGYRPHRSSSRYGYRPFVSQRGYGYSGGRSHPYGK